MLTLQPSNSFTVVRQIADHTDGATYYVRAVIRNAYTDALITNLDLTSRGSQRFSKNWQVPADPSGEGFYISIVSSVYTDSGYTTKSENYGDEENTYLIQERVLGSLKSGAGGLGMADVRRIFKEEVAKIPQPEKIKFPEQKEIIMRWDEVLTKMAKLSDIIGDIPTELVNLGPLMLRMNDVAEMIKTKPITPTTDLAPIQNILEEASTDRNLARNEFKSLVQIVETALLKKIEEIKEFIPEVLGNSNFTIPLQVGQQPKKEEESNPIDINKLST